MKVANSIPSIIKKTPLLWVYYIIMMLVLVSWNDHQAAPPEAYRYIYLTFFILPLFFEQNNNFLFLFIVFYTIGLYGIGFSYLPNRSMPYALLMIVLVLKNVRKERTKLYGWGRVLLLSILMVIVDYLGLLAMSSSDIISVRRIWSVIIICLLPFFLSNNINADIEKISFGFVVVSLILSLEFIFWGSNVAESYDYASGIDRVAWMDPNYFAPVVGMGLIMSVLILLEKYNDMLMKVLLFFTIVVSSIAIILSASRGAVSAVSASLAVIILFSKVRTRYKVLMIIMCAVILILFYNSGYFDLLKYKLSNKDSLSSGAGRYDIWSNKVNSFFNSSSIISLFFGVGYNVSFYLGYQDGMGFHNDYIAFLCTYGIVGVILFALILLSLLFFVNKENRTHVFSLWVLLSVVGITVEPLCNLYMPYWFLLFYIYCKANSVSKIENEKNTFCT